MKIGLIRAIVIASAGMVSVSNAYGQDDLNQLLKENLDESKILIGEYISPFMKSVSLSLNQGWYNTAKPHKLLGVDLTVTVNAMNIPDDQTYFNVQSLNLQHIGLRSSSPDFPNVPTIFGSNKGEDTPIYYSKDTNMNFDGPLGIGLKEELKRNVMPVPIAQLAFGLPKGTDLKIRFVPNVGLGSDGNFQLWGVGVMHDIKQWIPGIKLLPFDLSGFVGHTSMSLEYRMDDDGDVSGENQRGEFKINATTVQALISKKISVVTFYGGVGYNIAKSNLSFKGTYDLNDDGDTKDVSEVDPLDFKYSASGPRATAGIRLKLAVFTLHADYSFQKYKAFTAGLGISVR